MKTHEKLATASPLPLGTGSKSEPAAREYKQPEHLIDLEKYGGPTGAVGISLPELRFGSIERSNTPVRDGEDRASSKPST